MKSLNLKATVNFWPQHNSAFSKNSVGQCHYDRRRNKFSAPNTMNIPSYYQFLFRDIFIPNGFSFFSLLFKDLLMWHSCFESSVELCDRLMCTWDKNDRLKICSDRHYPIFTRGEVNNFFCLLWLLSSSLSLSLRYSMIVVWDCWSKLEPRHSARPNSS